MQKWILIPKWDFDPNWNFDPKWNFDSEMEFFQKLSNENYYLLTSYFCCEEDGKRLGFFEIRVIHISDVTERKF